MAILCWAAKNSLRGTVMFVQDGFLYLIMTRHKLTVCGVWSNVGIGGNPCTTQTWWTGQQRSPIRSWLNTLIL
jgi:hypothetical protein